MNLKEAFEEADQTFNSLNVRRVAPELSLLFAFSEQVFGQSPGEGAKAFLAAVSSEILYALPRQVINDYLGKSPGLTKSILPEMQRIMQSGDSNKLLQQASRELSKSGFNSFSFLDNGTNAIVLKGQLSHGTIKLQGKSIASEFAALRFFVADKPKIRRSIVLPPSEIISLPYNHHIQILPFASDRYVHHPELDKKSRHEKWWGENLLYAASLLHAEGKFAWAPEDATKPNIMEWNSSIWVCDEGGLQRTPKARVKLEAVLGDIVAYETPHLTAKLGVRDAGNFALLNSYASSDFSKIEQWGMESGIHTIRLTNIPKMRGRSSKDTMIVVDLRRKRLGRNLVVGMRKALKTAAPA